MGYDSAGIDDDADEPLFVAPPPPVDPFEQCKPPKGKVYQWVTTHVMGDPVPAARHLKMSLGAGWKYVPKKRHPKFKSKHRGLIAFEGMVLMEMPHKKWEKLAAIPINEARSMDDKYRRIMTGPAIKNQSYSVTDFPNYASTVSPNASTYVPVPKDAPPIPVSVTIQLIADANWQDAASICGLTIEKYAQNRISIVLGPNFKVTRGSDV